MINLLPTKNKKELVASIHNRILVQYIFLLLASAVATVVAFGFIYLSLKQSQDLFRKDEENNNQKVVAYEEMKKNATELSTNLNQAKSILSQRVDYSKVLFEIAKILPPGVSINAIKLESKLFEGVKQLEINLQSEQQIVEVKKIMEDSGLFKSVSIDSVVVDDESIRANFSVSFERKGFGL